MKLAGIDEMHAPHNQRQTTVQELRAAVARGGVEGGEKPLGREDQYDAIQQYTAECFRRGKGGVVYVAGISGTGKSVTVHAVLRSLGQLSSPFETPPALVSINCMSLSAAKCVYDAIWGGYEEHRNKEDPNEIVYPCLSNIKTHGTAKRDAVMEEMKVFINSAVPEKTSSACRKNGKKKRKRSHDEKDRSMLVVFLDEIDNLITKNVDVLVELFSLACSSRRFVLIGAANSLDLTDRWMREFEKSECIPKLVSFPAYRPNEVANVLRKLLAHEENATFLSDNAIQFLARKACGNSRGDMRGVFHICLAALAAFEEENGVETSHVDVKEMTSIFAKLQTDPVDAQSDALAILPLDQQILLLSIVQLIQGPNEAKQQDVTTPVPPPVKRTPPSKKRPSPDAFELSTVYQRYTSICKDLCLDASSRADVSLMAVILCDSGILAAEKRKKNKRFRLVISPLLLRQFFASSRLFNGMT